MSELAWFLVGLMLGGCAVGILLCCLQFNRISEFESSLSAAEDEIEDLKQELNNVRIG